LPTVISAESSVRMSAYLGHDQHDVIKDLIENFGLDHIEATALVTREYARRQTIDDQDAADAEFDTEEE
jgi:hypothetical protein